MATAPTLVRVFWEKNKDLQDRPDDPVSSEARRQGRRGASNGAECTWCGGQWEIQSAPVDNCNNALDTSKGARGEHEHGMMMDGTWRCHRPWYIGGNISRWILRFAKIALRWCKQWQTVTWIFRHIITDDDRRQILHVVMRTTYYTAFPHRIAASSYPKRYEDIILGICVIILDHTVGIWKILPLGLSPRT